MTAQAKSQPQLPWNLRISQGYKRARPGLRDFFVNILGQVRILKKAYPGIMHFMIFWGVTVQVIGTAINLMQMALFTPFVLDSFPRQGWYLAYELIMDLAGLAILIGVTLAAFRRLVLRPKTLETRWDDLYALAMLFLIVCVGFLNEGTRLYVVDPPWAVWSPIGYWVANLLRATGMPVTTAHAIHNTLVYIHVGLALVLVASIPFTKLRHLINTPLNILLRPRRKTGELDKIEDIETTELLGVGKVSEFTSAQLLSFDACVRCGRCEDACPANFSGMPYSPRTFIQSLRSSMVDSLVAGDGKNIKNGELSNASIDAKTPWYCTTCGACLVKCPAFVNPVDEIIDLRRYQVLTTGAMPKSVGDTMRNLERQGNPWGMAPDSRMDWAEGLEVREVAPGDETDVLFFVGCAASFDVRNKNIS
jgi:heterodisulfide reductase subunit C